MDRSRLGRSRTAMSPTFSLEVSWVNLGNRHSASELGQTVAYYEIGVHESSPFEIGETHVTREIFYVNPPPRLSKRSRRKYAGIG